MTGIRKALTTNTDTSAGKPKMNAVFRLTTPCLYFGNAPTKLVAPTMNNE
jgi:hypothetical protein